jgi:hypothetical protein
MKHVAAVGFRSHSGWTALVVLSLDGCVPRVLLRQRPHLVKTFTFEFRQPYHTAEKKTVAEARSFLSHMQREANKLARQTIENVRSTLAAQDCELTYCGLLLASGRPLPALERILASHALIHTADGELFREALLSASRNCGLEVFTLKESELMEKASFALQLTPDKVALRLASLGSSVGSPWTQDEKMSTLVAWLSLLHAGCK